MKNYTQEEINDISIQCIRNVKKILEKYKLSVGHVDYIIDNLMASFTGNSMVNIPVDKQTEYLKDRLQELSSKLAYTCEVVHKMSCDDCKDHESKPEGVTVH
jgi:Uri superfamily endonuclease